MACFHPLRAWRTRTGEIHFGKNTPGEPLQLPCGKCVGCRLDRSKMWAVRCVHEAQLHQANSFITLTYSDEHLPRRPTTLIPEHLRDFFKRLRHYTPPIRYYACGEYGDKNWRPHYHALIFGFDFPDRELWSERGDIKVYRSGLLERVWKKGFCTVGELTPESAAYTARYTMKKVGGDQAPYYYSELDPYSGELVPIQPEFSRMSLKPGIGAEWFAKYHSDVFPDDFVVLKGKRYRVPDYYDELFEREMVGPPHPAKGRVSAIKDRRKARGEASPHNTPERLAVREKVTKAKISKLVREI